MRPNAVNSPVIEKSLVMMPASSMLSDGNGSPKLKPILQKMSTTPVCKQEQNCQDAKDIQEGSVAPNTTTTTTIENGILPQHAGTTMLSPSSIDEFAWIHHVSFPAFVVDIREWASNPSASAAVSFSDYSSIVAWNSSLRRITHLGARNALHKSIKDVWKWDQDDALDRMVESIVRSHDDENTDDDENDDGDDEGHVFRHVRLVIADEEDTRSDVTFQIKLSSQRNPYTGEISGLICLVEKENNDTVMHQSSIPSSTTPLLVSPVSREQKENTVTPDESVSAQQHQPAVTSLEATMSNNESVSASKDREQATNRGNGTLQVQRQLQSVTAVAPAEEYRQLIETANAPIFGVDLYGIVNEWNASMATVTGISKQNAIGMLLTDSSLTMPMMQNAVESVLLNAFRGRGTSNFELEILTYNPRLRSSSRRVSMIGGPVGGGGNLCADGECSRFLIVNVTPRRNLDQKIVGAVAIAQDVTEACNHDRAVAAMANELRQLIDTANAPIFGIDRDGDVNEWNDKTAEITGYTKEEAFDCSLVDTFIVPDIQDSVQDVLDNALDGRGTSNYELEFRTKSNEIRHLLVNATPQRDMDNNIVGVVAIAQDVTEAVQRDRAVAGMALELRQLIDTANAPIFGIDIDGNVNEWNRRTSEITGYTKEEAFDEPLVETFIAPPMQEKVQEILDSALAGNETSNYELEFVSKSGEPIFLLVNATTRRDPENVVVGVVGVAQDVTEDRKHAQALREMQTLRASQEAKVETERNMTAYFAHELRNPLGAIDSALNAMPDDLPESARSLISGMQLCTGFMSSIMNNLLDVRKMEEGKMQLSKAPISLRKLLNNVHKMLLPSVRDGVEFRKALDVPKGKGWVLGDAHRIQQVMTNVVTNAIKYTVSGYIELFIGWEGENVKFVCEDTGPGIPKSEQEKLFQRFVQRGGAPGTGLGLAIAKHLVDLTGGSIRFDSDPTVKAGTRCIVLMSLPVCEAPESIVEESTALIQEPISFLIIDDIKMNRMMLKRRIKKGIAPHSRIVEAATGEEALEVCGKDKFDVIIVDQYMEEAGGVMVGTDVVFAMRRMRIDSVIIGCSGNDMGTQFKDAGADWVWQKPMPSNGKIIQDLRASLTIRDSRSQQ